MSLPRPLARLATILCALTAVQPLVAQRGTVFREEVEVRLVEIEVVVTDADGGAVTGLKRGDFELRQDRRRLEITHFSAVEDGYPVPTDEATEGLSAETAVAENRLHIVLYVDHAHLQPGELGNVVAAVRAFLERGLRPWDRVMLVNANHSLEIVHGFTSEPEPILAALDALEPQAPRSRAATEFPHLLREIERNVAQGPDIASRARDELPMTLKTQIETYAGRTLYELGLTTQQLHRLIPALAGLPGRRDILYIGGTLPTDAPRQLYNAWRRAFGPGSNYQTARGQDDDLGRVATAGLTLDIDTPALEALFLAVAEDANSHGVTLHVLDAGGLRRSISGNLGRGEAGSSQGGGVAYGSGPDSSRRIGNPGILETMAEATGGRALVRSRNFDAALDGVSSDLRNYYVLGLQPAEGEDAMHEIQVKLKSGHKKVNVQYRRMYRSRGFDRIAAEQVVSALLLGEADNPLGIELVAEPPLPVEDRDDIVSLPLIVIFPVDELALVSEGDAHRGQLSLYFAFGDLEMGASEVRRARVPLTLTTEQLADAAGRSIEYELDLLVPTASAGVAVTVRDDLRPINSTVALRIGRD